MANSSLSGRYTVLMDNRGRISFPAAFRAAIGEKLYISPKLYQNVLVVRSEADYIAYRDKLLAAGEKNGDSDLDTEEDIRDFCMMTATVVPDKNGRITIPDELVSYAGITSGKAAVLGIVDYAEIWDSEELKAYEEKRKAIRERKRRLMEMDRDSRYKAREKAVDGV